MFIVLGHTHKYETFVIGYTTSRKKADRVADSINENNGDELYAWAEVQTASNIK